jgi:hypothetical protein
MGGYNSGRWHGAHTRITVEECLGVSMGDFRRCKNIEALRKAGYDHTTCDRTETLIVSGAWSWGRNSIAFRSEIGPDGPDALRLSYFRDGQSITEFVSIETVPQHFGGRRWWFRCPECNRRCGKVYLPPGGHLFACRQCYRLTYRSCNESGRFRALEALLIAETGVGIAELTKVLRSQYGAL